MATPLDLLPEAIRLTIQIGAGVLFIGVIMVKTPISEIISLATQHK